MRMKMYTLIAAMASMMAIGCGEDADKDTGSDESEDTAVEEEAEGQE